MPIITFTVFGYHSRYCTEVDTRHVTVKIHHERPETHRDGSHSTSSVIAFCHHSAMCTAMVIYREAQSQHKI